VAWDHAGPSNAYAKGAKVSRANAVPGGSAVPLDRAKDKAKSGGLTYAKGKSLDDPTLDDVSRKLLEQSGGTSIFDPVLCEIAYRWFSPVGGLILDPFAGGSVRGIVASKLGRQYIGHELRQEQVDANRIQGSELCGDDEFPPAWITGDSRNIDTTCADVQADMVFSCPPYADLEVYSDDPKDLSTMKHSDFKAVYFEIIKKACDLLKPDRFACFVVGEVCDKKGNYIDFVGDTVQAFRDAGLHYYNEAILITCVGSLPIRAGKQFSASRKLGKTHQNVLVFVKGDGKRAATACGPVQVAVPDDAGAEDQEGA
jgi:DNA modification methylase